MKLKLTDNIALKLLSIIAAIALWVVVVNINDAPDTARYMMEVGLINTGVITDNGKVFRVEDGTDTVRLTVKARRSVLEKLKPTDFTLTADMEKDLKYDSLVGISVECRNKSIDLDKNVTLSRSNVKVSIEDSATEHFPVTVRAVGTKNAGLEIGDMIPEQTIIRISGPVSIIERIKRVEAEVDVTGLPATSTQNCRLKILDGNNEEMDTTYLNYTGKSDGMDVTVSMLHTKTLPLNVSYIGSPAENHEISNLTCKPEVVTVAGNVGVLAGMSTLDIPAEAINVDGISEDLQVIINLKDYLPSGVLLSDDNDASVLVTVEVRYTEPADREEEEKPEDDGSKTEEGDGAGAVKPEGNHPANGSSQPPLNNSGVQAPSEQQKPSNPQKPSAPEESGAPSE